MKDKKKLMSPQPIYGKKTVGFLLVGGKISQTSLIEKFNTNKAHEISIGFEVLTLRIFTPPISVCIMTF